jgi:hypothetical protein
VDNAKNFAKVTVSTGYDAAATSIVLNTGDGAKLPTMPCNMVWWNVTDYPDPTDDPNVEIVRCTALATDTLTVTRAQESTTASTKNTASKTYKMVAGLTAKVINTDLPSLFTFRDALVNNSGTVDFNPLDPTLCYAYDDWLTGAGGYLGWSGAAIGAAGSTTSATGLTAPNFGAVKITTTATSGQGEALQLTQSNVAHFALNSQLFDCTYIFQLQQTATTSFYIGFAKTTAGPSTDFIGLRYDTNLSDTAFTPVVISGSTATTGTTFAAADTSWHKIRIFCTVAGTIQFSLDGGTAVSISSGVPTAALFASIVIITRTTTAASVYVDFFSLLFRGLSR